ncbi:MAG: hypothetical protein N4A40_15820 [Tissierellales bacterium]|jgi:hypothetical protein|nr:hypothetical protein [Tissierellales bacterium]
MEKSIDRNVEKTVIEESIDKGIDDSFTSISTWFKRNLKFFALVIGFILVISGILIQFKMISLNSIFFSGGKSVYAAVISDASEEAIARELLFIGSILLIVEYALHRLKNIIAVNKQ